MVTFLDQHRHKLIALTIWLSVAGVFWTFLRRNDLAPLALVQQIVATLTETPAGPILYVAVYAIRPLLLFPSTLLSVAAGYLFGPVWGVVYAVLGSNASATVDYLVGYYFGRDILDETEAVNRLQRYTNRLRGNSFEAVLVMRFLFLPYDTVSLFVGFLRVRWREFALATFLGGLPGSLSFVLFGASIEGDLAGARPRLQPWTLALSAMVFVLSLALSRYVRHREAQP